MFSTAVPIVAIVFAAMALRHFLETRTRIRESRMRLIEKAIDSGQLDHAAVRELLTGGADARAQLFWRCLLAVGWFGLFGGGAMIVGGIFIDDRAAFVAGIVASILSFAVITFPMAVRELESRPTHTGS